MPHPLVPIASKEWTPACARHLLNRAGFGIPVREAVRLASMTPGAAVARFVDFDKVPEPIPPPEFLPQPLNFSDLRRKVDGMSEEERKRFRQERMGEERQAVAAMQDWWLDHMLTTLRPLESRLMLFWHGHFATSAQKVKAALHNWQLLEVFRSLAAGNFRELVRAVGKSPAMLVYLDNQQSRKEHPNENWAREMMELFTLGRGNYTENDIKEAARAFTGWTQVDGRFQFRPGAHDGGVKLIFGRKEAFDGDGVLNLVFEQPAAARFVSRKLWEFFAYESPEEEVVEGLAREFRASGFELKPLLRTIFLSQAFYSDRAVGTQVKSPVQLVLGLIDSLHVTLGPESARLLRMALAGLGQDLLHPPNVKGWPGNRAWIDTNSLLLRCNAAGILVNGLEPGEFPGDTGGRPLGLPRRLKPPFDASRYLKSLEGARTVGEAVDRVTEALLTPRPSAEQRRTLVAALRPGAREQDLLKGAGEAEVRALVHLVTSMAEYQLC